MFNRKETKAKARKCLKEHYIIFVVAVTIAAFIGSSYSMSFTSVRSGEHDVTLAEEDNPIAQNMDSVLYNILAEGLSSGEKASQAITQENQKQDAKIAGIVSLGYRRGILASLANSMSNGSIFVVIYESALSLMKASDIPAKILVVLASLLIFFVNICYRGVYEIVFRRIFLEGYLYKEVKAPRFLYIFKIGKWFKAALTTFIRDTLELLWWFTIIGGIIKHYSYSQVYYITAENPDVGHLQALRLSKRMMKGHKWEMFKMDLSFLGWDILAAFTFGASAILYSNPYKEATYMHYYVYLRDLAKQNGIDEADVMNDEYLYRTADEKDLIAAYPDLYANKDVEIEMPELSGIKGFIAKYFGIILKYDEEYDAYNKALVEQNKKETYYDIFNLENYPARLGPHKPVRDTIRDVNMVPLRQYSATSLILIFFIFAFIGWIWEVSLHLVKDGVFVNRGVLHGPWLPIYGFGVLLIVIFLYKTRKSLPLHFFSAIVLCGIVEYFTAYYLELTHGGMKWWDYTGYFLNIHGRICAEGLLIFGLGGCAAVYVLAPVIDARLRKISNKILIPLCAILVCCYIGDSIYSKKNPNMGEGITDYEDVSLPESSREISEEYIL